MKKYVLATIRLPIEINEHGVGEPLKDYIQMDFSKCDELPPKQNSDINYDFLINNLQTFTKEIEAEPSNTMVAEREPEPEPEREPEPVNVLYIEKSELIKHPSNKKHLNTTFKNNHFHSARFTAKSR